MALAILQLLDFNRDAVKFNIDTGTNRYYQLRIGRSVQRTGGMEWVDDVVYTSPTQTNPDGGNLFHAAHEIGLSARHVPDGESYVQMFSFKDPGGQSTTFSDVVPLTGQFVLPSRTRYERKRVVPMSLTTEFAKPRKLACATAAERYARAASVDDVLGGIVKLATPLVGSLLSGGGAGAGLGALGGAAGGATGSGGASPLANVLAVLLQAIMGNSPAAPVAAAKSLSLDSVQLGNRFKQDQYSRPFIFGVDDALIGALAGPILQMLPQLMNSANQRKIQMKQTDDKLITDILSDVNRRMILQQLASSQPAAGSASPDVAKLIALLQDAPAAQAAPAAAPGAAATDTKKPGAAMSLSLSDAPPDSQLSKRAVVDYVFGDLLPWNDSPHAIFMKGNAVRLNVKLTVGEPAPKSALPKAILKVVFKNKADGTVVLEKTFKLKNIAANSPLALDFSVVELTPAPIDTVLEVVTEMRWLTPASGREVKALGTQEIVFVNKTFLKSQGSPVATELELTDMSRFRPFWNKIWESPVLDAVSSSTDDNRKYNWELDVAAKYSVLLSPMHDANGLMDTKILKAAGDPESLSERTEGRMKAGIELSISELNKLLPQWPGHEALDTTHLQALRTAKFVESNAGELVSRIKLKGSAGERGLVWVVPVFNLVQCTFSTAVKTDDNGQVCRLTDDVLSFPLPVATRVICLKSHS